MRRRRLNIAIGAASGLLALATAFAATRLTGLQGAGDLSTKQRAAPEFAGITTWFNSEPLTMAALRGEVVWLDFWTYSCINCIRALPGVRAMQERYGAHGLRVIGVHSPEFVFEKDPANVRTAIAREDITYPVALDAEMDTWRAYGNQYWPRVYLVDARGQIRFDHIGEGGEAQLQQQVRALLTEAGRTDLPPPVDLAGEGASAGITPEVYAGYGRGGRQGSLANPEGYSPEETTTYRPLTDAAIGALGSDGRFALAGPWKAGEEFIEAAGAGARLDLPFRARNVFIVGASARGPLGVRVLLDGKPVPESARGAAIDGAGARVDRSDLYRLIEMDGVEEHVLTLIPEDGFRLYTFTFG